MKIRYGCLTYIALFTLLAAVPSWLAKEHSEEGGALPLMVILALGAVYFVTGVHRLATKNKRQMKIPRDLPESDADQ